MVASLRDENPVAHGVFTPFRMVWRLSMSLVLVWLLACAIQIGYVAHNDLDPQAHFDAQMDYYLAEPLKLGVVVISTVVRSSSLDSRWNRSAPPETLKGSSRSRCNA